METDYINILRELEFSETFSFKRVSNNYKDTIFTAKIYKKKIIDLAWSCIWHSNHNYSDRIIGKDISQLVIIKIDDDLTQIKGTVKLEMEIPIDNRKNGDKPLTKSTMMFNYTDDEIYEIIKDIDFQ